MGLRVVAMTHPGQKTDVNQDIVYAKNWIRNHIAVGVIAVADGMGGYSGGERAAKIAIEELDRWCTSIFSDEKSDSLPMLDKIGLDSLFIKAHRVIMGLNSESGENSGTTLTVCIRIGDEFIIGNIGDTRCYKLSGDEAVQLSIDDSWLAGQVKFGLISKEEAINHPKQNLLTRCVGLGDYSEPHSFRGTVETGQVLCVCSDGFYKNLKENEMVDAVNSWKEDRVNPLMQVLQVLFHRGEMDNISLALIL